MVNGDSQEVSISGDVFSTRQCNECPGFVIEKYATSGTPEPGDFLLPANTRIPVRPSIQEHDEPSDTLEIPADIAEWFRAQVNAWADEIKRLEKESPNER